MPHNLLPATDGSIGATDCHRGRWNVIAAPSPVLATDMRRHLVYEIEIDNSTRSHVRLDRLEVRDPFSKRVALCEPQGRWSRRATARAESHRRHHHLPTMITSLPIVQSRGGRRSRQVRALIDIAAEGRTDT
jgi:hypothetical protein